jgi:hypothetical protein
MATTGSTRAFNAMTEGLMEEIEDFLWLCIEFGLKPNHFYGLETAPEKKAQIARVVQGWSTFIGQPDPVSHSEKDMKAVKNAWSFYFKKHCKDNKNKTIQAVIIWDILSPMGRTIGNTLYFSDAFHFIKDKEQFAKFAAYIANRGVLVGQAKTLINCDGIPPCYIGHQVMNVNRGTIDMNEAKFGLYQPKYLENAFRDCHVKAKMTPKDVHPRFGSLPRTSLIVFDILQAKKDFANAVFAEYFLVNPDKLPKDIYDRLVSREIWKLIFAGTLEIRDQSTISFKQLSVCSRDPGEIGPPRFMITETDGYHGEFHYWDYFLTIENLDECRV